MIEILDGGYFSSIQDLGRLGWGQYGIPRSGAMDEFALRAANRLVGNPDESAGIEVGLGGIQFRALEKLKIAVCGWGFKVWVNGNGVNLWQSVYLRKGQIVRIDHIGNGMWVFVAIEGGIDVKPIMGSQSTSLIGNFGGWNGRLLKQGDCLPIGHAPKGSDQVSERILPASDITQYNDGLYLRVVVGPHSGLLGKEVDRRFFQQTYTVSPSSNRIGYRLQGEPVTVELKRDMISFGMLPGAVQIPPSGEPIVMMADAPTSGGYPVIAVVIRADLPLLAQAEPLKSRIRFKPVSVEVAREAYIELKRRLDKIQEKDQLSEPWNWAGAFQ